MSPKTASAPKVFTAETADRLELYQLSLLQPEFEVEFLSRVFRRTIGRKPLSLLEDYCGTAALSAAWVCSDSERTAVAVDQDAEAVEWGRQHNMPSSPDVAKRLQVLSRDRKQLPKGSFDVCAVFRCGYCAVHDRIGLVEYFRSLRESLLPEGMLFLDAYGGYESHQPGIRESREVPEHGFTYIWHQFSVDAISNLVRNLVHFDFHDGSKLRKVFVYHWRLWSLAELRDALTEAGFRTVTVYWEDTDEQGEPTGVFEPRNRVPNEAGWTAYLVARV